MSERAPQDPRAEGFRRFRVSHAPLWSQASRRLLAEPHFTSGLLGVVAAYLCVDNCVKLVAGFGGVHGDEIAAADCPVSIKDLRRARNRLNGMRDTILHLGDITADGSAVNVDWRRNPDPIMTISTADTGRGRHASMTRTEIDTLLDALDPWLRRHYRRLVLDAPDDEAAAAE
jgi:hypothetical protein